ncbi:MAG: hypothetical protein IT535_03875 [Bauldia sp.]|nr:hypothetical protein [Bauldia sp.]
MLKKIGSCAFGALLALTAIAGLSAPALAQGQPAAPAAPAAPPPPPKPPSSRPEVAGTWVETSSEVRMQLDFAVNPEALAAFIPAGYEVVIATQGPAARCNIRVIFIDRIEVTGPDNRVLGSGLNSMVYLAVPGRDTAAGQNVQIIIGGIVSDAAEAPGPFDNYIAASDFSVTRTHSASPDGVTGEESWSFETASGEHLAFSVDYTRAPVNRGAGDNAGRFVAGQDPSKAQLFRVNQGLDIAWNATTLADRVGDYEWSGGGGAWATLFDGTEELLSIDVINPYEREIYTP